MILAQRRKAGMPEDEARRADIEALAQRAAAGSEDALSDLFETLHDATYRFIYRQVRNPHLAEDLDGKTWMKIVHKISTYTTSPSGFESWVYTIARNTVRDEFRSMPRSREIPTADMLSVGMPTSLVSQDATPEETALDAERVGEMRVAIAKALESLPPNQRRALVLRFFDGLDVVQVASVMQTTPSNVRNLQSRGARRLASQLPDLRLLSMRTVGGEKVIANAQGERHATR